MGMLSNLGNSLKKSLGLKGPSGEELDAQATFASEEEKKRLREVARQGRLSEQIMSKALASRGKLSFGNRERSAGLSAEQRSLRSTGRFDENRLVL